MEYPQPFIAQQLGHCALFADWPADRLRELSASARRSHYERRTALTQRHEPWQEVFVVVTGAVEAIATNAAGEEHLLATPEQGQLVGLMQLYDTDGKFRLYDYWARAHSTLIHLRGDVLARILDEEPRLWKSVALFTLQRFHLNLESLQSQVIGSVRRRLAVMLTQLAQNYGVAGLGAQQTSLHVSQTDLARMLGLSRQTVAKELAQLKSEGVLGSQRDYGQITVQDMVGLLRIADEL
jgi:CRP-like cAMP-binding protein